MDSVTRVGPEWGEMGALERAWDKSQGHTGVRHQLGEWWVPFVGCLVRKPLPGWGFREPTEQWWRWRWSSLRPCCHPALYPGPHMPSLPYTPCSSQPASTSPSRKAPGSGREAWVRAHEGPAGGTGIKPSNSGMREPPFRALASSLPVCDLQQGS